MTAPLTQSDITRAHYLARLPWMLTAEQAGEAKRLLAALLAEVVRLHSDPDGEQTRIEARHVIAPGEHERTVRG